MFISPDVSRTLIKPIVNPLFLPSIRRSDTEGIPKDLHSTPYSFLSPLSLLLVMLLRFRPQEIFYCYTLGIFAESPSPITYNL